MPTALLLLVLWCIPGAAQTAASAPVSPAEAPLLVAASTTPNSGAVSQSILWRMDTQTRPFRLFSTAEGSVVEGLSHSHDGQHIAYVVDGLALWQVDADGRNARILYALHAPTFERISGPRYAPDSKVLGFTVGCCGNFSIYRIGLDGSGLRRLSGGGVRFLQDWAPDGTHILFTLNGKLWTADPHGSHETPIGNDAAGAGTFFDARYSPDNTHITASLLPAEGVSEAAVRVVVLLHDDGRYLTTLTGGLRYDATAPTWSPDGKRIAFIVASGRIGPQGRLHDVWVMRFNGRQEVNVSHGTLGDVTAVVWER